MTKKELVYLMVATNHTITIQAAESTLDAFMECVNKTIARGEKVSLPGFGTFSVTKREAWLFIEDPGPLTWSIVRIPDPK